MAEIPLNLGHHQLENPLFDPFSIFRNQTPGRLVRLGQLLLSIGAPLPLLNDLTSVSFSVLLTMPEGMPLAKASARFISSAGANTMIFSEWLDQRLVAARKYVLAVSVSVVACVIPLSAQQSQQPTPSRVEAKVIIGSAIFGDDIEHKLVGGALRAYVTKRLSIEPEYLYLRHSDKDQDHLVQPNVAFDFITDSTKRLIVYGIAGVGVLHHQGGKLFFNDFFTGAPRVVDTSFTTWTATAGVGAKIFVTKRLFVSPELRLGREPTVRATINVGYVFAGRR
jgi:hypothetical protein